MLTNEPKPITAGEITPDEARAQLRELYDIRGGEQAVTAEFKRGEKDALDGIDSPQAAFYKRVSLLDEIIFRQQDQDTLERSALNQAQQKGSIALRFL